MDQESHRPVLPSDVPEDLSPFDRFAGWAASVASRAPFFAFCLLLVVTWLVQGVATILVTRDPSSFLNDKYQLEINTTTTIITFLMVALLQNASTRGDHATQDKLNVMADGLADLMDHIAAVLPGEPDLQVDLQGDIRELRSAVGLELRESTSKAQGR